MLHYGVISLIQHNLVKKIVLAKPFMIAKEIITHAAMTKSSRKGHPKIYSTCTSNSYAVIQHKTGMRRVILMFPSFH